MFIKKFKLTNAKLEFLLAWISVHFYCLLYYNANNVWIKMNQKKKNNKTRKKTSNLNLLIYCNLK